MSGDVDSSEEGVMRLDRWGRPTLEPHYPVIGGTHDNPYVEVSHNEVSAMQTCQTSAASVLCIFDIHNKVTKYGQYDIGGTYTNREQDLWFYCTTSFCPGDRCLLSLFVCFRKVGSFDIGVSKSNEIGYLPPTSLLRRCYLNFDLKWQVLVSNQPDDKFFLKTYCIPAKLVDRLGSLHTLCIPIKIINSKCQFNTDLIEFIQLNHNTGDLIAKEVNTDLTVCSASGKQYHVHKIVLAARSPVLRKLVKGDLAVTSLTLDISDVYMKLLLDFLYTGTVKDILNQDFCNLLDIATKFELNNLTRLIQKMIE